MVVQMGADPGHVAHHGDAVSGQEIGRTEPGQLQQLR